jgi:hypothetical protein
LNSDKQIILEGLQQLDGWGEPVPFDSVDMPDFPLDSLPSEVADFVEALSESTQTPLEMAGILALGVLATAFQSRYEVHTTSDWKEPLCLYTVAVANPAERKSAVIGALTKPIRDFEGAHYEGHKSEIAKNHAERRILEKRLAQLEKAAACSRDEERHISEAEAREQAVKVANFTDIHALRLLVDDTTPEKLVDILDQQGGCVTVCSSEGGIFDAMRGRYDQVGNFDIYTKAHDAEPVRVDRIGRGTNYVERARLSMILTVQPAILKSVMQDGNMRGRGLCARFLFAVCRSAIGKRNATPPPVPQETKDNYSAFIARILTDTSSGVLSLDGAAMVERASYQNVIEKRLGGEWEHMQDWGGKLVGTMLRIAALIHCSERENPASEPISVDTVEAAIKIAECLAAHAESAYRPANQTVSDARYLWGRIVDNSTPELSKRELFQLSHGKFSTVEDMEPAIYELIERGYIRISQRKTGGRPTEIIFVNPNKAVAKGSKAPFCNYCNGDFQESKMKVVTI